MASLRHAGRGLALVASAVVVVGLAAPSAVAGPGVAAAAAAVIGRAVQVEPLTTTDDVPAFVASAPFTVTLTSSDDVTEVRYLVGADPADPAGPANNPSTYDPDDKPVLGDGERIRYVPVDVDGNIGVSRTSAVLRVDDIAPTTRDDVPTGFVSAPVAVTLTPTDAESGVAQVRYLIGADPADPTIPTNDPLVYDPDDKPVLGDGQRIRYSAIDAVGNVEPAKSSAVLRVDDAAPVTTDDVPVGFVAGPRAVRLTPVEDGGSGLTIRYLIGVDPADPSDPGNNPLVYDDANRPVLDDGERIRYSAVDAVGNVEPAKSSAVLRVDDAVPSTTDDVPAGFVAGPRAVRLTPIEDGGSELTIRYLIGVAPADPSDPGNDPKIYDDSNRPLLGDGQRIRYSAIDVVGNTEQAKASAVLRVDDAPPLTTDNLPTAPVRAPVTVRLIATDALSGVSRVHYTIETADGTEVEAGDYNDTARPVLDDGQRIRYAAVDAVRNEETTTTSPVLEVDPGAKAFTFAPQPGFLPGDIGQGNTPTRIASADVDADGDMDLVTVNRGSTTSNVLVFLRRGGAFMKSGVPASAGSSPRDLVAANLDADPAAEFAIANYASDAVTIRDLRPDGIFVSPATTVPIGGAAGQGDGPVALVVADLGGDDRLDLAVASQLSDDVAVLTRVGAGLGDWSLSHVEVGSAPSSLVAADLDGDGDVDLATANAGSDDVTVLTRNAGGFAASTFPLSAGSDPAALAAADLDGDDVPELATANAGTRDVTVLTRTGSGDYTTSDVRQIGRAPTAIGAIDADADGLSELVVTNQGSNDYTVILRSPNGSYGSVSTAYGTTPQPADLTVADLDGDNVLDFATANQGSNDVTVFSGTTPQADRTPPTVTDDVPAGPVTRPVTVTLTATDVGSEVASVRYTTGRSPADPSDPGSLVYDEAHKPVLKNGELIRYVAIDAADNSASGTSIAAHVVTTVARPRITGPARVGDTLRVASAAVTPSRATVAYQWLRRASSGSPTPIRGATGRSYDVVPADVGRVLLLRVTASSPGYETRNATSARTAAVTKGRIPGRELEITGVQRVGKTITARLDLPRIDGLKATYRWTLAGARLSAARSLTLPPRAADKRVTLTVDLTARGYQPRTLTVRSDVVRR